MAEKNIAVFSIHRNRGEVGQAIDSLITNGFRHEDIAVLLPDNIGTNEFAHKKHTKAAEDTMAAAGVGAVVGGTLGLLVGIGALAIPGLGPFIAAGPIVALTGVGTGGVVGGLIGALAGWAYLNMKQGA